MKKYTNCTKLVEVISKNNKRAVMQVINVENFE